MTSWCRTNAPFLEEDESAASWEPELEARPVSVPYWMFSQVWPLTEFAQRLTTSYSLLAGPLR
jgi:hypothetical protein